MAEDRAKAEENVEELEKWARVRERGYAYPRVLLKLSGEALAGDVGYGIDPKVVDALADEIADIVEDEVEVAVVVGHGIFSRVQSAITMQEVSEPYIRRRAVRHLEKGRVVILAAGTGNPYFTTDTTAALRACELNVDCLMKATKVDGVYDSDPSKNPDAKRFDRISYMDVLSKGLNVMDSTATSLCMDNHMPMIVFDLTVEGNISRALKGENVGTTVE